MGSGPQCAGEHPDRFAVVDLDDDSSLAEASAVDGPRLAMRAGTPWVRRLGRVEPRDAVDPRWTAGTVLITGGTGGLGGLLARTSSARTACGAWSWRVGAARRHRVPPGWSRS
ncbi:hypothetical protein GCM10022243_43560 [Saccharothrix violaceirubra]|uniref:NADPH:quinone reductase-like Zn-dependent oxidoreductase n=1 Tax=Saccharothrix violaceirubra TaxID=413306 RepID=A0A7W7WVT2_9PSEU|nr:hypothetical protein [Saccharothrix violaceirubra]MBB4965645.1 NADPH:quinone reductase-like Zn-dependent oxidoreductase [Saccharothrix violaceirubra]